MVALLMLYMAGSTFAWDYRPDKYGNVAIPTKGPGNKPTSFKLTVTGSNQASKRYDSNCFTKEIEENGIACVCTLTEIQPDPIQTDLFCLPTELHASTYEAKKGKCYISIVAEKLFNIERGGCVVICRPPAPNHALSRYIGIKPDKRLVYEVPLKGLLATYIRIGESKLVVECTFLGYTGHPQCYCTIKQTPPSKDLVCSPTNDDLSKMSSNVYNGICYLALRHSDPDILVNAKSANAVCRTIFKNGPVKDIFDEYETNPRVSDANSVVGSGNDE